MRFPLFGLMLQQAFREIQAQAYNLDTKQMMLSVLEVIRNA
ncbi:hypothetical protein L905_19160 [Agrobacterium sp. TS43]|nr:hypothetical protein L903_19520 [Agrobacterium sp. JL28]KVK49748.1 hypothetical protein L904_19510 [Agrobacterium sp. LY4]KVK62689.1 hypothetical protein L906_18635 [Agrobacterium sp. TS45]KVK65074.1 hypothetical protein L905_19160 [Agrobacterium sp. TS43]KVK67140.1 hypothetical protein L907_18615 [Agrobacterium sp. C13]